MRRRSSRSPGSQPGSLRHLPEANLSRAISRPAAVTAQRRRCPGPGIASRVYHLVARAERRHRSGTLAPVGDYSGLHAIFPGCLGSILSAACAGILSAGTVMHTYASRVAGCRGDRRLRRASGSGRARRSGVLDGSRGISEKARAWLCREPGWGISPGQWLFWGLRPVR